jgi:hypothetical protein
MGPVIRFIVAIIIFVVFFIAILQTVAQHR